MTNRVLIKRSGTANSVPLAGDLQAGELAINYTDGNLFYKNSSNVVTVIASNQFVSVTGNVTGNYFIGNGSQLTGITVAAGTAIVNGNSNVTVGANGNITVSVAGTSNVVVFTPTGQSITGAVSATGNVTGAYIIGNGSALTSLTGSAVVGNVGDAVHAYFADVANSVSGSNVSGQVANALVAGTVYTNAQPNITSVGTLTSLSSSGNITGANINGNGSGLSSITGGNVTGQVANALIAGTVYTNAQPNITSVGILSSVSVTGNVTGGNLITAALVQGTTVSASGNVIGGNVVTAGALSAGSVSTAGNINGANVIAASAVNAASVSASGNVTAGNLNAAGLSLSSNVVSALNVTDTIAGGNITTPGLISATGNLTSGNVNTTNLSLTGNVISALNASSSIAAGTTVSAVGNVTGGNVITGGALSAASVSSSGNVTGANIIASAAVSAASVSASGNVTGGNLVGATAVVVPTLRNTANLAISATGNINLQPTANIVVNNTYINGVALNPVQDQDVATKYYVDTIASSGIAYHAPVTAATTDTLANITGGTVSYTQPNGAGNGVGALLTTTGSFNLIDTANVQILGTRILVKDQANSVQNGVYTWANATNIVRSTDTDEYGPNSVEQFSVNDYFFVQGGNVNKGAAYVVNAPTGTITFGTSNITFAEFSTSQTYTANTAAGISLAGTVINAKTDGVTTAFDGGGNIIVKASANLITPNIGAATGTSLSVTGNITSGNLNAAGLSLTSNVVSALNVTANIAGGNITTPGLISATGNITGNYFIGNGSQLTGITVSVSKISNGTSEANIGTSGGNANVSIGGVSNVAVFTTTGLNISGNISATGNISPGLFYGGGNMGLVTEAVTSPTFDFGSVTQSVDLIYQLGLVTAPGDAVNGVNIIDYTIIGTKLANGIVLTTPNIGDATGTSVSITGNVTGGNLVTIGLITATGNITGGNVATVGVITATGNVTGGNVATAGAITATGNVTGGNLLSPGLISATGTVFADKITTVSIPQVLDDISNQCDGAKMVFRLTNNLANITSANIADSKNLQVAVNGLILSPWINTQTWPWFQTFAGFPTRSPGYQVNTTSTSANITFYRSPAQGSQVVLTIINNSSTTQLRKYPYSATTIVLGD
jgi:hypothetical protein